MNNQEASLMRNTKNIEVRIKELPRHQGMICGLAWSPDGKRFCTASADGDVRVWTLDDLSFSTLNPSQSSEHETSLDQIRHMAFSATWSADDVVAVSFGEKLNVWRVDGPELIEQVTGSPNTEMIWSPSGSYLARSRMYVAGGYPRYKVLIGTLGSLASSRELKDDFSEMQDLAWSPNEKMLAVASHERVALSKIYSDEFSDTIVLPARPLALAWLSDRVLAAGCVDANIRIYSLAWTRTGFTNQMVSTVTHVLEAHQRAVVQLSYSSKQNLLASLDASGEIRLWAGPRFTDVGAVNRLIDPLSDPVYLKCALHPDKPTLAVSISNRIWLLEVQLDQFQEPHPEVVSSLVTAPTLSKVFEKAMLGPDQKRDSDHVFEDWAKADEFGLKQRPDKSDPIATTMVLRQIAEQISVLNSIAIEGMLLAWDPLEKFEEVCLEDLELAVHDDPEEGRKQTRHGLSELLLHTMIQSKVEQTQLAAFVAYIALAYGSRLEFETSFSDNSEFWKNAASWDTSLRRLVKTRKNAVAQYQGDWERVRDDMTSVSLELQAAIQRAKGLNNQRRVVADLGLTPPEEKRQLRKRMIQFFSIAELDEICLDVQSDLEQDGIEIPISLEIVGGDGKPARIQNLIEYLDRRGYLSYLIKAVQAARPRQNII